MIQVAVDLSGIDALLRNLRDSEAVAERELGKAVASVLDEARDAAAQYPPELPNQVYIRTGDLGEAWATAQPLTARTGDTVTVRLQNLTPYAGYVQDEEDQAAIHRGRWDTTAQIMRDVDPLAQAEAERAAAKVARAVEGR
jgi:hypothetical protein